MISNTIIIHIFPSDIQMVFVLCYIYKTLLHLIQAI